MTQPKEKCFLFYERWFTQLSRLPSSERLEVYEAICRYAFSHETTSLVYYLESIMDNIRITIDENEERQRRFLELQKEKSRKGVEARKLRRENETVSTSGNPTQPTGNPRITSGNPTQPTGNPRITSGNPTQPYNKNKKNNKNKNKEISPKVEISNSKENLSLRERTKKSAAEAAPLSQEELEWRMKKRMKGFYESLIPFVPIYGKDTIRQFYDYWSEPNKSHTRFRMELERTWDLSRRLLTWIKREHTYGQQSHPSSTPPQPTREQRDADFIQHIQEKLSRTSDEDTTVLPWEVSDASTTSP